MASSHGYGCSKVAFAIYSAQSKSSQWIHRKWFTIKCKWKLLPLASSPMLGKKVTYQFLDISVKTWKKYLETICLKAIVCLYRFELFHNTSISITVQKTRITIGSNGQCDALRWYVAQKYIICDFLDKSSISTNQICYISNRIRLVVLYVDCLYIIRDYFCIIHLNPYLHMQFWYVCYIYFNVDTFYVRFSKVRQFLIQGEDFINNEIAYRQYASFSLVPSYNAFVMVFRYGSYTSPGLRHMKWMHCHLSFLSF